MELGLTFPLQRQLKIRSVPYGTASGRWTCWDLHGITLRGRSSLLIVHCASRYTLTVFDTGPLDRAQLPDLAVAQIRRGLEEAGIPRAKRAAYWAGAGAPELTRTHGRREVAFLNRAWEDVLALDHAVDTAQQAQPLLDRAVNLRSCRCAGQVGVGTALSFLRRGFGLLEAHTSGS